MSDSSKYRTSTSNRYFDEICGEFLTFDDARHAFNIAAMISRKWAKRAKGLIASPTIIVPHYLYELELLPPRLARDASRGLRREDDKERLRHVLRRATTRPTRLK